MIYYHYENSPKPIRMLHVDNLRTNSQSSFFCRNMFRKNLNNNLNNHLYHTRVAPLHTQLLYDKAMTIFKTNKKSKIVFNGFVYNLRYTMKVL